MKTIIAVLVLLVAVLEVTVGQDRIPEQERLAKQEEAEQVLFNRTYVFAVAYKAPIAQLDITDSEAKTACAPTIRGGNIYVPHPRSCHAFLVCSKRKKNPFMVNTVYYLEVYIQATPQQTFWDQNLLTSVFWSTVNQCPSDSCKTNRAMTDGRSCYTYTECVRNSSSSAASGYQTKECPDGQSFNVAEATCQPASNCNRPKGDRYTNIACAEIVPKNPVPGVPKEAYYNRTFINHDTNNTETVETFCPAGLIFNRIDPNACECVSEIKPNETCPMTIFHYYSQGSINTWKSIQQDGNAVVELSNGSYQGWVRLDGGDSDYFNAMSFANNELTGTWTIRLSFAYNGAPSGDVALMTNSLDLQACPTASIRLILATSSSTIRAEATNFDGFTVNVVSNSIPNLLNRIVNVQLSRDTIGRLNLTVDNTTVMSIQNLGNVRLRSSECGMILGHGVGLLNFRGWMNGFALIKNC